MSKILILLLIASLQVSCSTSGELADSAYGAVAVPVLVSNSAYSGAKSILQGGAITLHLPDISFAEEINRNDLLRLLPIENVFAPYFAYMGARSGYDYYVYMDYINGESQKIVKVKRTSQPDKDTLTSNPLRWKVIKAYGMGFDINLGNQALPLMDNTKGQLTPLYDCIEDTTDFSLENEENFWNIFVPLNFGCAGFK